MELVAKEVKSMTQAQILDFQKAGEGSFAGHRWIARHEGENLRAFFKQFIKLHDRGIDPPQGLNMFWSIVSAMQNALQFKPTVILSLGVNYQELFSGCIWIGCSFRSSMTSNHLTVLLKQILMQLGMVCL